MKRIIKTVWGIKLTVIENNFLPPSGFSAINLFPFAIYTQDYKKITDNTFRHEAIHTLQTREMLILPYYLLYLFEYFVKFLVCWNRKKAYYSISFEQEAHYNRGNINYRQDRKWFAFAKYIFKMYKQFVSNV